jgi:hypothetical protein
VLSTLDRKHSNRRRPLLLMFSCHGAAEGPARLPSRHAILTGISSFLNSRMSGARVSATVVLMYLGFPQKLRTSAAEE